MFCLGFLKRSEAHTFIKTQENTRWTYSLNYQSYFTPSSIGHRYMDISTGIYCAKKKWGFGENFFVCFGEKQTKKIAHPVQPTPSKSCNSCTLVFPLIFFIDQLFNVTAFLKRFCGLHLLICAEEKTSYWDVKCWNN